MSIKKQKMTLNQLESLLLGASDILRGSMNSSDYKEYIFGMLFLKRVSDEFDTARVLLEKELKSEGFDSKIIEKELENPNLYQEKNVFYVPKDARWSEIQHEKKNVGTTLNKALAALEDSNPDTLQDVLKHINFTKKVGSKTLSDNLLVRLIQQFDKIPMKTEDFEHPDLLGSAYEYLIKYFADDSGQKGGEFYTPAAVVRLLVEILAPEEGMSVYDPTVGSGGMLIQSKQFIAERGGNSKNIQLAGQEFNGTTWSICKMNMILHGVLSADIRHGDTLENPLHLSKGILKQFNRVIANPPFSQKYSRSGMQYEDRFQYGFTSESSKAADLMFVQHMVASLKSDGKMATVLPHGVLFRSGKEQEIRKGMIRDGLIEAVIGLPAGLFYGTGIPACILVIDKKDAKTRNGILFINADREYKEGKNQNILRPEDIEKIASVYHGKTEVEKYSKVISVKDIEDEDYNLNIRRYVDNTPKSEPHDVKAHLFGGIPKAEINNYDNLFTSYQFEAEDFFCEKDTNYFEFCDAIESKEQIKEAIESSDGVAETNAQIDEAFNNWWNENYMRISELNETRDVFNVKTDLLKTFKENILPIGVLDTYKCSGVFVTFWNEVVDDLRSISSIGWGVELLSDDELLESQFPLEFGDKQKLEKELSTLDSKKDKEQIKLTKARLKELEETLDVEKAKEMIDENEIKTIVLNRYRTLLSSILHNYLDQKLREIIKVIENVWDKYTLTADSLEKEREEEDKKLKSFLKEMGYVE